METVFETELLLETILENLGPRDMKVARRVSKQWNYRATRILLAKQLLTVTHAFQNNPNHEQAQKLLGLERTMKESALFPACTFAFSNCNFSSPYLQHLFHTFGHLIHTLDISLDNGNLPGLTERELLHSFKHVIFVHLPNVERLTLASKITLLPEPEMSEENEETTPSGNRINSNLLAKLKFLCVESALPENIFELILGGAKNMEEVDLGPIYNEKLLYVLRRRKKMHLLISTCTVFREDNLDLMEHLCNAKPQLRKVFLFLSRGNLDSQNLWLEASKMVTRLLEDNAHSLDEIEIPPLFYLPQFYLPVMPRLRILFVLVPENCSQVFAPTTFKMSRVFPRLSWIFIRHRPGFESYTCSKEMYENNFLGADYNDTVSTVTVLWFEKEPEFVCIQKLPLLFPNIRRLEMQNLSNVFQVLNVLWVLPVVAHLYFSVSIETLENLENANWNTSTNTLTVLDGALTGISQEMYAHHACAWNEERLDAGTLNKLRLNKSMLDAKSLRCLSVGINDDSAEERTSPTKTLLSKIALRYAFEMSPHVKVKIILKSKREKNVKNLLDGISPVLSSNMKLEKEQKSHASTQSTSYIYSLLL